jgi:GNAT superfamily N-acetyltransferase
MATVAVSIPTTKGGSFLLESRKPEEIYTVGTLPHFRKRGYSELLMRHVLAQVMRETGINLQHVTYSGSPAAQVDELYQIERWGDDPLAIKHRDGVARDIDAGARFLALLEHARLRG